MLPIQSTSKAMDFSAKFNEWTMQGVQNTCGYLASKIMPVALQTGALFVMICIQELTPTSSITLINNSLINCAFLYFPSVSTAFRKTEPFKEDTMKLMSGCHAGSVHPSETMLTLDVVHDALIGSIIFCTSFFAFVNNVVLSFSEPGGTYHDGDP